MAGTLSTMLPLGTPSPDFSLPDTVSGRAISLETFKGKKALLVMFICRHCPYVKHIQKEIARIGREYGNKDVGIVAITSNDREHMEQGKPVHWLDRRRAEREGGAGGPGMRAPSATGRLHF